MRLAVLHEPFTLLMSSKSKSRHHFNVVSVYFSSHVIPSWPLFPSSRTHAAVNESPTAFWTITFCLFAIDRIVFGCLHSDSPSAAAHCHASIECGVCVCGESSRDECSTDRACQTANNNCAASRRLQPERTCPQSKADRPTDSIEAEVVANHMTRALAKLGAPASGQRSNLTSQLCAAGIFEDLLLPTTNKFSE